jgi:hypothetical protein
MKIFRSVSEPIRTGLSWEERWGDADRSVLSSWERGREKCLEAPDLATDARNGQLVLLPWKGGIEKAIKKTEKYGVFNYLAMWQGLRGDDLDVDLSQECSLTCSITKMTVIFTSDYNKFANQ